MTYQEFDTWLLNEVRTMPRAMNDRALQSQAAQAGKTDTATAAGYGANASAVGAPLTGFAENMMTAPPGYGTALPGMEAQAAQAGNEAAANTQEQSALTAARTRNAAGLNASQDAEAQNAARSTGSNVQDILAQNAQLQQQQRSEGAGLLSGIYGTDVGAQLTSQGQVPGAVNAGVNAGNSGWLQNTLGILGTLGGLGLGAANTASKF